MTKLLAFDTATAACSAALSLDGECISRFQVAPRKHGKLILTMIDELLTEASLELSDCDAIVFGNGPGSFMGLRIAAGIAQGLAYGAQLPVIPISSLQGLAQEAHWQSKATSIIAAWDARMSEVYWGAYTLQNDRMKLAQADQLGAPEILTSFPETEWFYAGNAWEVYFNRFNDNTCYPSAKALAFLAECNWSSGLAIAPESITLSYLRNKVTS